MQGSGNGRRWRGRWIWVAAVLVAAAAVGVTLVARNADGKGTATAKKKPDADAPLASPVELSAVRRGDISTYLQSTSMLEARNAAALVAQRQGQVVELDAEEGRWVARGTVLARLDDTAARLAVERGEVALDNAKRELERGRQMQAQGFLSPKEMDDLQLKQRSADVDLAQARFDLSQMRIVAPFDGCVTSRSVNLGETVTPGRECFRLEDFSPVLARVHFPEKEASHVRVGQEATVELDAHPGEIHPARVTLVNPVVDRDNGTFKVTLELPNAHGTLRPGAFAHVRLRTGSFAGATLVPRRGILTEDGDPYVFVARGDSVVRVTVQVGAVQGDDAQVVAGLVPGERVVTGGQGGLKNGAKIKVVRF
ncbi:MAG: efflux RND transporter periplasmic adaptor subunit [Candidatus Eisenbacteria bacterium]